MAAQEKFDLIIKAQDEATATLRSVNREVDKLGGGSVPRLTTSLSSYTREAAKADLKSAALGSRLAGMSPAVSQLSNALLIGNPIIAGAAFAIGVLSSEVVDAITAHDRYVQAIKSNRSELEALARSTDVYGASARKLIEEVSDLDVKERARVARLLSMANHGLREATTMERLGGSLQYVKMEADEQKEVVADLTVQMAKLNKEMAPTAADNLRKAFQATIGPMTSVGEVEEMVRQKIAATNEELRQRQLLMRGLDAIGPLADTTGLGFSTEADQVAKEQQRIKEAFEASGAGPMTFLVEHDQALDKAMDKWREFSSIALSSADQLSTGITDIFFGLRDSLDDVFRGMAQSWVKYFINEILKQTALRLGFSFFNIIFPGAGSLVGGAAGVGDVGVIGGLARSSSSAGIDIASAGAKRFSGPGPSGASVVVNINGPILGEEEHVNRKVIPIIERAIRFQTTTIAGR